ncbi:BMC_2a_G0011840.mRNA.1.CDS.1 [Saccharomyces cerevisiae]|nr:Ssf2p [Saccharomyces cerevisiae YJM1447]CAI4359022.1 BMC_2a_G0011840.mRNA.1.CDS.1 [Saccharomyces cerevisiae]CAI4361823.1 BMB_G0011810.mRNA.1.CDS.1 [Saccharomyces cerevisiae]CAI7078932.1 BMC_2a_G0011840.mRNA.1.CDS.1 [Saccharomyces cerevisiae]CAI7080275.1 BMB_G0011810.mRNA.1.CDS.1 [Saccharomyces cerevisiae]
MAKRRQKKRTHAQITPEQERDIPKSMVIRVGQTSLANHSLNQLVKDFRQIMQPHTAVKLKERKSNKLKDFVVMCGPLGVTHLFMFTQSEKTGNVSLKIARTPQGPTVTFQVLDYSLGRDIKKFLKRPKSLNNDDVLNPPLLVLNGFSTSKRSDEDDQDVNLEKVIVSMFQNIFPPLNPARTSLNSIKRIFMINKDRETGEISMRHYFIDIREVEISRNLKRLYKAKNNLSKTVPNLHRKEDISSLILDHDLGAYTSESEIEDDAIVRVVDNQDVKAKHFQTLLSQKTPVKMIDNEEREKGIEEEDVEMEEPKPSENSQPTPRKKAIKLTELGPRLTLKLIKIEDGICSGKVLHHEFVQKSSEEIKALEKRHAAKMRLKEQRRKEQEENIAKKKAVKDAKKQRKLERRKARAEEQGEGQGKDGAMSDDGSSSSEDEHYSDVPEDLDSDLFSEVE